MSEDRQAQTTEQIRRAIEALAYGIAEQSRINQLVTGGLTRVGTTSFIADEELQAILRANETMISHLSEAIQALRGIEDKIDGS